MLFYDPAALNGLIPSEVRQCMDAEQVEMKERREVVTVFRTQFQNRY
jgi:hypothetical protein